MPSSFQKSNVAVPVTVANGGTGDSTLTNHGVLLGQGTSNVAVTGAGTTGQVLTSNGASADPTFQTPSTPSGSATVTVTKAGENLSIRDTIVLLNDCEQGMRSNSAAGGSEIMGDGTRQQRAIRIKPSSNVSSSQIYLRIAKSGAPTDNVFIEVQTDSASAPSGTPITNGTSNNVAGSGFPNTATTGTGTVYQSQLFTFASAFTLTAGTVYWIVVKRDGAQSGANFYVIDTTDSGDYAEFKPRYYTGAAWSDDGGLIYFTMSPSSGTLPIQAWKAKGNNINLSRVDGFATAAATAGNTFTYQTGGEMSGFSGLTPGRSQFPTSTAGAISETPTTYGGVVGVAVSTSVIDIQLRNECVVYTKNMAYNTGITSTLFIPTGFRMRSLDCFSAFAASGYKMSAGFAANSSNQMYYFFDSTGVSNATSGAGSGSISSNGHIALAVATVTDYGVELSVSTSVTSSGVQIFKAIR